MAVPVTGEGPVLSFRTLAALCVAKPLVYMQSRWRSHGRSKHEASGAFRGSRARNHRPARRSARLCADSPLRGPPTPTLELPTPMLGPTCHLPAVDVPRYLLAVHRPAASRLHSNAVAGGHGFWGSFSPPVRPGLQQPPADRRRHRCMSGARRGAEIPGAGAGAWVRSSRLGTSVTVHVSAAGGHQAATGW